jgi:hypothetical protein
LDLTDGDVGLGAGGPELFEKDLCGEGGALHGELGELGDA